MQHQGRHALVTGGGTGIGLAIAKALAAEGAEVTITGRRAEVLDEAAAGNARLHPLPLDVADEAGLRAGIAAAAEARGPISICIANAGIAEFSDFPRLTLDDWRRTMAINLDGVFLTIQASLATLAPDAWGRVIAVSSIAGLRGLKSAVPYTASKHGVVGLIRALSELYLGGPVTFNALCPGYVDTPIVENQLAPLARRFGTDEDGAREIIAKNNRHRRLLEVDEVAGAALWLCSDAARSVNGQTIEIFGGQV